MRVTIFFCSATDLDGVYRSGPTHPLLGRYLDGGSYAAVGDIPTGLSGAIQIRDALLRYAKSIGLTVVHIQGPPVPLSSSVEPLQMTDEIFRLDEVRGVFEEWCERIAREGVVAFVVADGQDRRAPLCVLYGRNLPAMGFIAQAGLKDVLATWFGLVGQAPPDGQSLLEEPASPFDAKHEWSLMERLRQLYGE